jgi:hypothetical protein
MESIASLVNRCKLKPCLEGRITASTAAMSRFAASATRDICPEFSRVRLVGRTCVSLSSRWELFEDFLVDNPQCGPTSC